MDDLRSCCLAPIESSCRGTRDLRSFTAEATVECVDSGGAPKNCEPPTFIMAAAVHTVLQPIAAMIDMSMATREKRREVARRPAMQVGVSQLPGGAFSWEHRGRFDDGWLTAPSGSAPSSTTKFLPA